MKAIGPSFFSPAMTWFRLVLVLGSLVVGVGCKPKIGEDCATSVDCSISGDRLCDVTQPGGYCTVFNCEPNLCPDDAVCVAFGEGTCSTASVSARFRRTFCMSSCEDDSDCRGGSYRCIDVAEDPSRWIVDINPSSRRICAVPPSGQPPPNANYPDPAVCFPSDASFDVSRPEAGPISSDAHGDADTVDAAADRTDDQGDSNDNETGSDAAADVLDSSAAGETGVDASGDGADDTVIEPEGGSDAPSD